MPSAVLIVYTNPLTPDREADFNAWYDRTHLPEVLAVEGFVAASRYRLSDAQAKGTESPVHRFMSIYEVETDDLQGALDTLMRSATNLDMGDSLDFSTASAVLWEEITPRVVAAGA
jgi:hypothetical protein